MSGFHQRPVMKRQAPGDTADDGKFKFGWTGENRHAGRDDYFTRRLPARSLMSHFWLGASFTK